MIIFTRKLIPPLLVVFKGAIVGMAGILPGISGGVLTLVFGFYGPFMEILARPITGFGKHWRLILPFAAGAAAGFWLTALFLSKLFLEFETEATCLFVGIVSGMLPALLRDAGSKGRRRGSWAALAAGAAIMLVLLLLFRYGSGVDVAPNFGWFVFCGVLWGLSMIIPGLNSTSLLLFMGLYIPMTEGLGRLAPPVALPWLAGIALALLVFSRGVNFIFTRFYGIAMYCVIGTALASTLLIIPLSYKGAGQIVLCALLAVVGAAFAVGLDRLDGVIRAKYPAARGDGGMGE